MVFGNWIIIQKKGWVFMKTKKFKETMDSIVNYLNDLPTKDDFIEVDTDSLLSAKKLDKYINALEEAKDIAKKNKKLEKKVEDLEEKLSNAENEIARLNFQLMDTPEGPLIDPHDTYYEDDEYEEDDRFEEDDYDM